MAFGGSSCIRKALDANLNPHGPKDENIQFQFFMKLITRITKKLLLYVPVPDRIQQS